MKDNNGIEWEMNSLSGPERKIQIVATVHGSVMDSLKAHPLIELVATGVSHRLEDLLYEKIKDKFIEKYTDEIQEELIEKAIREKLKADLFEKTETQK